MLEDMRQYSKCYGTTKKCGLPIYTYMNHILIHMLIFVIFCKRHGYIKNIRPIQSYCNCNSIRSAFLNPWISNIYYVI